MAQRKIPQRVVAELGRPETPDETAARKAQTSRTHRAAQTLRNLIWSLVATLLVVLVLVLVVVRPDPAPPAAIDYREVASQAQGGIEVALLAPVLPPGWKANEAELRTTAAVRAWYIGFVTPGGQFIAMNQAVEANPTWIDTVLDKAEPTGSTMIEGVRWVEYDNRTADNPGNVAYALVTESGASTVVLNGTASNKEFVVLATALGLGE